MEGCNLVRPWHLNESCAGTYLGDFKELGGVQHSAVLCSLHSVPTAFIDPLDTCQTTNTTTFSSSPAGPWETPSSTQGEKDGVFLSKETKTHLSSHKFLTFY